MHKNISVSRAIFDVWAVFLTILESDSNATEATSTVTLSHNKHNTPIFADNLRCFKLRIALFVQHNAVMRDQRGVADDIYKNYDDHEDLDPLCCCEYVDLNSERNHILGCCCNCVDLDLACER